MTRTYRKVDKAEFEKFVADFRLRKPLVWDVANMCEPPIGSYNDFLEITP